MAYSEFSLDDAVATFGLTITSGASLFDAVPPVEPDPAAKTIIERFAPLATLLNREKPRSELIIAQTLGEALRLTGFSVGLYSGTPLVVDVHEGLTGVCDYIFTPGPQLSDPRPPVLTVVEGKKEDVPGGFGQCAAEMVAALRLNRRAGTNVTTVYGCVTTGSVWRFLRLKGAQLAIDFPEYQLSQLPKLLGILLHCVGEHPAEKAAA